MFLPIDIPMTPERRAELLRKVIAHCGFDPANYLPLLTKMAHEWPVSNPTPGNRHKELYKAGRIQELQILMGSKWAEIEYLKNMASIILPFMADLGYKRRDLIKI